MEIIDPQLPSWLKKQVQLIDAEGDADLPAVFFSWRKRFPLVSHSCVVSDHMLMDLLKIMCFL